MGRELIRAAVRASIRHSGIMLNECVTEGGQHILGGINRHLTVNSRCMTRVREPIHKLPT